MKKEFVPYYLAVQLKDLGFNEECLGSFTIEDNSLQIVDMYNLPSVVKAPLWQQAGNFLYICSNKKINISINGSDTYEELCEKFEKAISNLRDLQNNKSKR